MASNKEFDDNRASPFTEERPEDEVVGVTVVAFAIAAELGNEDCCEKGDDGAAEVDNVDCWEEKENDDDEGAVEEEKLKEVAAGAA